MLFSSWRTGGGWIINTHLIYNKYSTQPPPPRFSLVSFCRYCSAPAVFFRFRSKNRACFIQASKRIPLQSLSVSNRPYICTHPPYRRNWLWWEIQKLLLLFFIKIYRLFIVLFPILPSFRRYAVCKPIVFLIPFFHKKEIRYTDI